MSGINIFEAVGLWVVLCIPMLAIGLFIKATHIAFVDRLHKRKPSSNPAPYIPMCITTRGDIDNIKIYEGYFGLGITADSYMKWEKAASEAGVYDIITKQMVGPNVTV